MHAGHGNAKQEQVVRINSVLRFFYAGGFGLLGGFAGGGVGWGLIVLLSGGFRKGGREDWIERSGQIFAIAGIIGFFAGVSLALFLFRDRSAKEQARLEKKYIGAGGHWRIFASLPMLCFLPIFWGLFDPLEERIGTSGATWSLLGIFLAVVFINLCIYERLPKKLIIPLGLCGWVIIFGLAGWYFWFGPGVFHHR